VDNGTFGGSLWGDAVRKALLLGRSELVPHGEITGKLHRISSLNFSVYKSIIQMSGDVNSQKNG
jgi:hypothetical protein